MHGSVCWVLRPSNFLEQCLCCRGAHLIFLDVESFTTAIAVRCVRQDYLSIFFALWKDADLDIPIAAKAAHAKLQLLRC